MLVVQIASPGPDPLLVSIVWFNKPFLSEELVALLKKKVFLFNTLRNPSGGLGSQARKSMGK